MPPGEDTQNPYAASSLYEPTAARPTTPLANPIVARGMIGWSVRRQAFLMAYGVSNRDLLSLTLQALIMVCFGFLAMVAEAWVPLLFMTPLFLLGVLYLVRRRWRAEREASEEHRRQGERWYERTITEDGIVTLHDQRRELTPWASYALIRQDGDLIVFVRRHPASFQAIPRSHFANEADWLLCLDVLREYIQQV